MDIEGISLDCNEFVKFAIKPAIDILKNSIRDNQELISELHSYHTSIYSWQIELQDCSLNLSERHFLFEQSYNFQCSFYLGLSGYYRYSWVALRAYLEVPPFFIYYSKNPDELEQWENRKKGFWFSKTIEKICKYQDYKNFIEFYDLKKDIEKQHHDLNSFVHPPRYNESQSQYYLEDIGEDFLKYNNQFIKDWNKRATLCVGLSNLILIIGLYDYFDKFKEKEKEIILNTLTPKQRTALDKFSNKMH
ncbi:MAG: hypothetical protein O8C63_08175 [Candidatus Methanoperedens sp.]|nr:hypothetical protein [Candidatus Methanoperedens sp.]